MPNNLTWRDTAAPDFRTALYGTGQATALLTAAAQQGGNLVDSIDKSRTDTTNQAARQALLRFQDPVALQAALSSGTAFPGLDASALAPETLKDAQNKVGTLISNATSSEALAQNVVNNQSTNRDRMADYAARAPFAAALAANTGVPGIAGSAALPMSTQGQITNSLLSAEAAAHTKTNSRTNEADTKLVEGIWQGIQNRGGSINDARNQMQNLTPQQQTMLDGLFSKANKGASLVGANAAFSSTDPVQLKGSPAEKAIAAAAASTTSSGTASKEAFVQEHYESAKKLGEQLGVDPSAILGQWGLETGWGKSVIPGTNNLGNIKDLSGGGVSAVDNMKGTTDKYRKFGSLDEFANHQADLINRMYPGALNTGTDTTKFFTGLKKGVNGASYAEDPNYIASGVAASASAAEVVKKLYGNKGPIPTVADFKPVQVAQPIPVAPQNPIVAQNLSPSGSVQNRAGLPPTLSAWMDPNTPINAPVGRASGLISSAMAAEPSRPPVIYNPNAMRGSLANPNPVSDLIAGASNSAQPTVSGTPVAPVQVPAFTPPSAISQVTDARAAGAFNDSLTKRTARKTAQDDPTNLSTYIADYDTKKGTTQDYVDQLMTKPGLQTNKVARENVEAMFTKMKEETGQPGNVIAAAIESIAKTDQQRKGFNWGTHSLGGTGGVDKASYDNMVQFLKNGREVDKIIANNKDMGIDLDRLKTTQADWDKLEDQMIEQKQRVSQGLPGAQGVYDQLQKQVDAKKIRWQSIADSYARKHRPTGVK